MKVIALFILCMLATFAVILALIFLLGPFFYFMNMAIEHHNFWMMIPGICWIGGCAGTASYYNDKIFEFLEFFGWKFKT